MKLREIMTKPVIRIRPEESVAVAARTLTHYNIGALPVCGNDTHIIADSKLIEDFSCLFHNGHIRIAAHDYSYQCHFIYLAFL